MRAWALPEYIEDILPGAAACIERLRRRILDLFRTRGYELVMPPLLDHSGVVFAAYAEGWSNALALGGRYDEVGKAFGRARPATGFSMDLRELASASPNGAASAAVLAPYRRGDATLQRAVEALRARGEIVIDDLPGHTGTRGELGCKRRLEKRNSKWVLQKVKA